MSELCNNSACFSIEIKGISDICVTFVVYACGKSAAPSFSPFLKEIFEMSELCNNSACFSIEIKGISDICVTFVVYACGKSILGVRTHEKDTVD